MGLPLKFYRKLALAVPKWKKMTYRTSVMPVGRPKVLVVGAYVANKENYIEHIVAELARAQACEVTQSWVAFKGQPPSPAVAAVTCRVMDSFCPKFMILNEMLETLAWRDFDYIIVCDDDIELGEGFLDKFIGIQQELDFALAQPARTWRSHSDHDITRRRLFYKARQTRFVEIGPLFSFTRAFAALAIPFSEESPMGWGYDSHWPILAEDHGWSVGIVDAVPVDHSLRARAALYSGSKELENMEAYLSKRRRVPYEDTKISLRAFR